MKRILFLLSLFLVQLGVAQIMIPFGETIQKVESDYKPFNMDRGFTDTGNLTLTYRSPTRMYSFSFYFVDNICCGGHIGTDDVSEQSIYLEHFSKLTQEAPNKWIGEMNNIIFRVTMIGEIGDPVCMFLFQKWKPY